MASWNRGLGLILLGVLLLPMAACGTGTDTLGGSAIEVYGITSPLSLFSPAPFTIDGLNFASAAGTDVTVRFTAVGVTPFEGGTSATADVPGTVESNTHVTGFGPMAAHVGSFDAFVTVILPTTAEGTSATPIASFVGVATEAEDDAFDILGNTHLSRDTADGLLANDAPPGLAYVTQYDAVSASGGDVHVDADGAFTYDPPRGFEGVDTFTYEIAGGIGTDSATVTITLTEMAWFIDRGAPSGGDGRQARPFRNIAPFMAIQGIDAEPGDTIFLYEAGGTPYRGPLTLLDDQILLGQGVDLVVGGEVLVAATTSPLLTQPGGVTLTLGSANTVRGLDVGNTAGTGIAGAAAGTLALDTVNVATTGGPALALDGVEADATFGTIASIGSATFGLSLVDLDGTLTVTGRTTVTNPSTTAVWISMGDGTVSFHGLDISTTSGNGLVTEGGCRTNVTGADSFVVTTTGRPLRLEGLIGSGGITFERIACDGAPGGIEMGANGTLGSLTITGDGTGAANGSGGTLRNCTGTAITLVGSEGVTLAQLDVMTTGGHGLWLQDVTDFVYEDARVLGAGDSDDEYGLWLDEVYGSVRIEDVVFDDINETAMHLSNAAADDGTPDDVVFRRIDVQDHATGGYGEHGIHVRTSGSADVEVLVDDCTFTVNGEGLLGVLGVSEGASSLVMTVQDSVFHAAQAFGSGCIQLQAAGTSEATFDVLDNDLNLSRLTSIVVNNDVDATSFATIEGNDIDASGSTNSGYGISLRQDEDGVFTALVEDNAVHGHGHDGIRLVSRDTTDGTGGLRVTLYDNTIGVPAQFGAGIRLRVESTNTLCANVSGNAPQGSHIFLGEDEDIVLVEGAASTLRVVQLAPTPAVDPSELDDANNSASVGVSGSVSWGQSPCPVPQP